MRDHGGNLDAARAHYGGEDWIDLSTGINRVPYPLPPLSAHAWNDLPTRSDLTRLCEVARHAYRTSAAIAPLAGAQGAIQLVPRLAQGSEARVLGPTYNEHAGALEAMGWRVKTVSNVEELRGAELAVIVNPNNPTGLWLPRAKLLALAETVDRLVVDESFADPMPEANVADAASARLWVLKSFGKFYGLAGLRLGFLLADSPTIDTVSALSGPWPVSGAAVEIGCAALADEAWAAATAARLKADAARADALAAAAGWRLEGGTPLFRLYATKDAREAQARLAKARIWSRIFPWSDTVLRLGLPGSEAEWTRLSEAIV